MFNLNDYEMVKDRLPKFWKDNPDGAVITEKTRDDSECVEFVAKLYRTHADIMPTSTGWAKTLYATNKQTREFGTELAETSAIGRALANYIYGGDIRASREEMAKTSKANFERTKPAGGVAQPDAWTIKVENPADELEVKDSKMPEPGLADLLESELGAEELPTCKHGEMKRKEGTSSKSGKPYMGYVCFGYLATGGDRQCDAVWYEMTPSGKWRRPKEKN